MRHDRTRVPQSCPFLDNAISGIEEARKIHDELRGVANDALERVEELEAQVADLGEELEQERAYVRELEAQA